MKEIIIVQKYNKNQKKLKDFTSVANFEFPNFSFSFSFFGNLKKNKNKNFLISPHFLPLTK